MHEDFKRNIHILLYRTLIDCPVAFIKLCMFWSSLLILVFIHIGLVNLYLRRPWKYFLHTLLNLLGLYILVQGIYFADRLRVEPVEGYARAAAIVFQRMNAVVLVLVLLLESLSLVFYYTELWNYVAKHPTVRSIKEGLDYLPTGLLYYWEDGALMFANLEMDLLAQKMLGRSIYAVGNGMTLEKSIREGKLSEGCKFMDRGPQLTVKLADQKVWQFHMREFLIGKWTVHEVLAYDITEENRLHEEVYIQYGELRKIAGRLRHYSESMRELTHEEEVLQAKIQVHDEIGRVMLATKRYLAGAQDAPTREELLPLWQRMMFLNHTATEPGKEENAVRTILEVSELLGIRTEISGKITSLTPVEREIFMMGARETLSNACRHAGAQHMWISIMKEDGGTTIKYQNDGKVPKGEIIEGGGLSGLRKQTEHAGGHMAIATGNFFILTIFLPERGKTDAGKYGSTEKYGTVGGTAISGPDC